MEMMKKLEKDEIPALLPIKRRRETTLRAMLLQLEVGEGVFLPFEKWKNKNSPAFVISHLKKTKGLRFEYGKKTDDSGWLFRRLS